MRCCVLEAAERLFSISIPHHGKYCYFSVWHSQQIRRSAFHEAFKKRGKLQRVEIVGLRKKNIKYT